MSQIKIGNLEDITSDFVPPEHMVDHTDRYYFRNRQSDKHKYRSLESMEIEVLVKNNNTAEDWDKILVSDNFNPSLVRNCEFRGMVRIGDLSPRYLEHHKLRMPVGLHNCTIISCDLGDQVALRNVRYLSHYIIGDHCILFNIDEMHTVDNAKFGNGIVKDGETEDLRIWLEVSNENGGRSILPFEGILPSDAYLWSRFREDKELMKRFKLMTDEQADTRRGYYGTIGPDTVIKNSRIIKDVKVGSCAYIKGANKLKNLTILSTDQERTQIGEGVELVNGIVGYRNRIFYGVKAVRFVTGRNVQVKYGARLINSLIGPNSTVSCCEILNNLIFPFHEQHHNNSFLIAATVLGQSNIAAGATIGSNHNSRAADGEIVAERGFWPGLESNFKHNSYFSCFTLVAKGSYHSELNITLPFSLVSPGEKTNHIQIMPGFWFRYNMYALARNSWKFMNRDKRKVKDQHIEMNYLAPDSAEQMLRGMQQLKDAISKAAGKKISPEELIENRDIDKKVQVFLEGQINKGKTLLIKPAQGYHLYQMMLVYYGARELFKLADELITQKPDIDVLKEIRDGYSEPEHEWYNLGGQLAPLSDVRSLIDNVKNGVIPSWDDLHATYDRLWQSYPSQRKDHALYCLFMVESLSIRDLDAALLSRIADRFLTIDSTVLEWTKESRKKDYTSDFRKIIYRNQEEMNAVLGALTENPFISEMENEVVQTASRVKNILETVNKTG